jgi:hypothetical protein
MTHEWVTNVTIPEAARRVDGASRPGVVSFARLPEDANQVYFSVLADSSTYCGGVHLLDVSSGRSPRIRVTVTDADGTPPPSAGFLGRLLRGNPKYGARPAAIEAAVEVLRAALPAV